MSKRKTAYEMRISDWSSDVCSSDLQHAARRARVGAAPAAPIRCASGQPQAGAELAHPCASNTRAYSLRLPAMLAVLYGALSHSARTSLCYISAFVLHPTAIKIGRAHV